MMELSEVSKTAISTLRSHVIESEKSRPIISDPLAKYCLEKLASMASWENQEQIFNRKLSAALTRHIAIRARKYDSIVNEFILRNPDCIVVNLGCGFDTRYWRINHHQCEYIELDLPEVIEIKKEVLKDKFNYTLIGCSVLDISWIDKVIKKENQTTLLIAEGLLMYLNKEDVIMLFKTFSGRFLHSQIVLEVVTEKYTRGIWKKIVKMKMRKELGLDAGSSYNFGIKNARELESYGEGIKVINEWSYFEDPDIRPRIYKYIGLSRTQWTVTAAFNQNK